MACNDEDEPREEYLDVGIIQMPNVKVLHTRADSARARWLALTISNKCIRYHLGRRLGCSEIVISGLHGCYPLPRCKFQSLCQSTRWTPSFIARDPRARHTQTHTLSLDRSLFVYIYKYQHGRVQQPCVWLRWMLRLYSDGNQLLLNDHYPSAVICLLTRQSEKKPASIIQLRVARTGVLFI